MLFALLFTLPAFARSDCDLKTQLQSLFVVKPHEGTPLPSETFKKALPYKKLDYELKLLGKGKDGFVSRVVPAKGKTSFIVKLMDRYEAAFDHIGFEVLRSSLEGNSVFKLQKAKILPGQTASKRAVMQLGDAQGRTLFSILEDPAVPAAVKDKLQRHFETGIRELGASLSAEWGLEADIFSPFERFFPSSIKNIRPDDVAAAQPPILGASIPYTRFFDPFSMDPKRVKMLNKALQVTEGKFLHTISSGEDLLIIIKSDNVIVTPDFELVIIDPK